MLSIHTTCTNKYPPTVRLPAVQERRTHPKHRGDRRRQLWPKTYRLYTAHAAPAALCKRLWLADALYYCKYAF